MTTPMTTDEFIAECLRVKEGNKEFALFYYPEASGVYTWVAEIGNPVPYAVNLGESKGEFYSFGHTAKEAVAALLEQLVTHRRCGM